MKIAEHVPYAIARRPLGERVTVPGGHAPTLDEVEAGVERLLRRPG